MPDLSILQPLKVMTPLLSAWLQPESAPPVGFVPIVRVTVLESAVIVLPPAS